MGTTQIRKIKHNPFVSGLAILCVYLVSDMCVDRSFIQLLFPPVAAQVAGTLIGSRGCGRSTSRPGGRACPSTRRTREGRPCRTTTSAG